jgi:probable phosphoglycerate mutase
VKVDFQRPFTAPDGAHEVLLVRHGAVDAPAPDGLIGGRSDPPLNARGREQAGAVAERLAGEQICALFTTPLRRTIETAAPILDRHDMDPVVVPELGEIFLGEWEGHGIHDRGARADPEFVAMMRVQRWDVIPGAEDQQAFAARVRDGIATVADAAVAGAVAVAVTHSAVIAEICRQATGSEPFAFLTSTNGSITRLVRMPEGHWLLLSFNETEHLRGGEAGLSR